MKREAVDERRPHEEGVDVLPLEVLDVIEERLACLLDKLLVCGLSDTPLREADTDDRDLPHGRTADGARLHKASAGAALTG